MLDYLKQNINVIWPLFIFLFGLVLPTPKFFQLGKKTAESIPPQLAKILLKRLKAFERGLMLANVNGDINLVDNNTVRNEIKKVKLDLGLKE